MSYLTFFVALCFHLILFIFLLFPHFHQNTLRKPKNYLKGYLIFQPQPSAIATKKQTENAIKVEKHLNHIVPKQYDLKSSNRHESEKIHEKLLKILHEAITTQQQYPESASELNQAGKVLVGFFLLPNGEIRHSTLRKSSGYRLLDQAALNAVKAISPLSTANHYLTSKRYFLVEIIFERMA